MKKTLLSIGCVIAVITGIGQIVVDQNDMPSPGDTIRMSNSPDISGIDFEITGANHFWDFSELYPISQQIEEFFTVQQTPFLYQLVFTSAANLAKPFNELDQFPGFELSDPYEYYRNNSSDFRYVGFAVTLNGIPVPNKYTEPDIVYTFPLNYGKQDSSMASFSIALPGFGYYGGWKKRVNHADGWGTLKTPYGEFDVLKIKSDIYQYDSVYLDTMGTGFPLYREYIEYKWIGKDFGLPLCTVIDDEFFTTVSYIDSVRTLFTGVYEDISPSEKFSIFPNPADEYVTIQLADYRERTFDLLFFDGLGSLKNRLMGLTTDKEERHIRLNLSEIGLGKGVWLVVMISDGDPTIQKLIVH
jgi:hypothetical protein